jgi:hypothetical protein
LLSAKNKDQFASLRLHLYNPALKTASVAEGNHTHMWDFSSLTVHGKITHFFKREVPSWLGHVLRFFGFCKQYKVFKYQNKDHLSGKRFLQNAGYACLMDCPPKDFTVGQIASLHNTQIHTVQTEPGTATLLLNHGYPSSHTNRMFFDTDKLPNTLSETTNNHIPYKLLTVEEVIRLLKTHLVDVQAHVSKSFVKKAS